MKISGKHLIEAWSIKWGANWWLQGGQLTELGDLSKIYWLTHDLISNKDWTGFNSSSLKMIRFLVNQIPYKMMTIELVESQVKWSCCWISVTLIKRSKPNQIALEKDWNKIWKQVGFYIIMKIESHLIYIKINFSWKVELFRK